jgi:hypothetical protein
VRDVLTSFGLATIALTINSKNCWSELLSVIGFGFLSKMKSSYFNRSNLKEHNYL